MPYTSTELKLFRDRFAQAIRDLDEGGTLVDLGEDRDVLTVADAALAVLPAPVVDRAAILNEAADRYVTLADQNEAYDRENGELDEEARIRHSTVRDVAAGLRRMAAETQQPTPSGTEEMGS